MPMMTYAASSHTNAIDGWILKAIHTVTPKALEFPPLVALIEAGDLAQPIGGGGKKQRGGSGGSKLGPGAQHKGGTGAMRQSGDR